MIQTALLLSAEVLGFPKMTRAAGESSPFGTSHQQPQERQRKKSTARE
jgi:hypothetical protein